MSIRWFAFLGIGAISIAATSAGAQDGVDPVAAEGAEIGRFQIRDGYAVTLAAGTLPDARFLETDGRGVLFVSRPKRGDIVALRDDDADGVYDRRSIFVSGKPSVHAMCFRENELWFATTGSVHRARDADGDLVADQVVDVIPLGSLPRGGPHWWRSLLVTDDGIFTSIGDSGNISDQSKTDRQKIWRFALDGSAPSLFASGLRNTEKLEVRPGTSEIWGVDHGSDWFGRALGDRAGDQPFTDVNPPDEVNLYVEGGFYGHPFVVGNRLVREEYRDRADLREHASKTLIPAWSLPAHWAANGFTFITPPSTRVTDDRALPNDNIGDMLVAAHGSWNSAQPVGYCIARVLFDGGRPYGHLVVVSTIVIHDAAQGGGHEVLARPVDCTMDHDGTVLFSSDAPSGRIYRLTGAPSPSGK